MRLRRPQSARRRGLVTSGITFGWIYFPPPVNRLIGLRWLSRILYPDAFPENLRPIVRDFYTRCYHQTPTAGQLDQLLGQPAPSA